MGPQDSGARERFRSRSLGSAGARVQVGVRGRGRIRGCAGDACAIILSRLQLQPGRVVHRGSPERPKKTSDELKREAAQKAKDSELELELAGKKALDNLRAELQMLNEADAKDKEPRGGGSQTIRSVRSAPGPGAPGGMKPNRTFGGVGEKEAQEVCGGRCISHWFNCSESWSQIFGHLV